MARPVPQEVPSRPPGLGLLYVAPQAYTTQLHEGSFTWTVISMVPSGVCDAVALSAPNGTSSGQLEQGCAFMFLERPVAS